MNAIEQATRKQLAISDLNLARRNGYCLICNIAGDTVEAHYDRAERTYLLRVAGTPTSPTRVLAEGSKREVVVVLAGLYLVSAG